jgi:hypothetical protein
VCQCNQIKQLFVAEEFLDLIRSNKVLLRSRREVQRHSSGKGERSQVT